LGPEPDSISHIVGNYVLIKIHFKITRNAHQLLIDLSIPKEYFCKQPIALAVARRPHRIAFAWLLPQLNRNGNKIFSAVQVKQADGSAREIHRMIERVFPAPNSVQNVKVDDINVAVLQAVCASGFQFVILGINYRQAWAPEGFFPGVGGQ